METLHDKTVKGVKWSILDVVSSYGITFIVSIILARILLPSEYGLIGIAMIFVAIANCFVDSGLGNAIIRNKTVGREAYSTVFVTNMVISILVTGIIWLCAPWISTFFGHEELTRIIRILSLIIIINALAITQRTRLTKELDFKTQTIIAASCTLVSGGVGIVMALRGYGVWALVWQQLSRQILDTVMLWVFNGGFNGLSFSFKCFKELFGFGWKILVSGLIQTMWRQAYPIVIGKCYGSEQLGYFTRANQFSSLFSENLTSIVQRVSFPSFSKIQDEQERLVSAYRKVIQMTMMVTFICLMGLAAIAEPMIYTLIGEKWAASVPMLQILSISMIFYPLISINGNMLQVHGRSDLFLKTEIIQKILALCTIAIGIIFNIYWMLLSSIATNLTSYLIVAHYAQKVSHYGAISQIKDILPEGLIALGIAIPVWFINLIPLAPPLVLTMQIIVGAVFAYILHERAKRSAYLEFKEYILKFKSRG